MFRWRKEIERLDIDARQVNRLYRSLGDIQVALAGLPSQEAIAYVCAFWSDEGLRVVAALYLKNSNRTAFFFPGESPVDKARVGRVMEEGIRFAESMGFIMGDTDFHLLDPAGKDALWGSLPLRKGPVKGVEPKPGGRDGPLHSALPASAVGKFEAAGKPEASARGQETGEESAGDGLSDSPPVRRSRIVYRKFPTAEEMEGRRMRFLENLGRFLVSF